MDIKDQIPAAWEAQFDVLFNRLDCANTRQYLGHVIHPIKINPSLVDELAGNSLHEHAKGLAG